MAAALWPSPWGILCSVPKGVTPSSGASSAPDSTQPKRVTPCLSARRKQVMGRFQFLQRFQAPRSWLQSHTGCPRSVLHSSTVLLYGLWPHMPVCVTSPSIISFPGTIHTISARSFLQDHPGRLLGECLQQAGPSDIPSSQFPSENKANPNVWLKFINIKPFGHHNHHRVENYYKESPATPFGDMRADGDRERKVKGQC